MNRRVIYGAFAVLVLVLAGYFAWKYWPRRDDHPPPPPPVVVRIETMDQLLAELAKRAAGTAGEAADFRVVPTSYVYPIGTLMEKGRSVADDDEGCVRAPEPVKADAPNLAPNLNVSGSVAGEFALAAPARQLGEGSVGTKAADTVTMTIDSPALISLTGAKLRRVLNEPACRDALAGREMLLVRGYVVGRRNFVVASSRAVNINGKTPIGSFEVTPLGDSKLAIADAAERRFLQVVSEVKPPPTPAGEATVVPPQAAAVAELGRIYVQRDAADSPTQGARVVAALNNFNTERKVEPIPSAKMPRTNQVRFFNETDRAKAEQVAGTLSKAGVKASVVRIPVPAPKGQLEVWVKDSGRNEPATPVG